MRLLIALAACLTLDMAAAPAPPADTIWPQFRGAMGRGIAAIDGLPIAWSATKNVSWKTAIPGRGWSSPIVWRDQVIVTSSVSPGAFKQPSTGIYGNDYVAELDRQGFSEAEILAKLRARDIESTARRRARAQGNAVHRHLPQPPGVSDRSHRSRRTAPRGCRAGFVVRCLTGGELSRRANSSRSRRGPLPQTMKAVFMDTAGWMACADSADPAHRRATTARDGTLEAGQTLVTSDFVVAETLTLIRFRLGIAAAEAWWRQVDESRRLRWERVDGERFEKARSLFFQHRDKDVSFTDCTSFVIMRELRLTHAMTTDAHFRQAGFQTLPTAARSPRRRG